MKKRLMLALLAGAGMAISPLQSAYVIEIDTDGADDGTVTYNPDFSFGGDTTLAYQSAASSAIGLTDGDSIYGGSGSSLPDTYVFTYSPDAQADNRFFDANTPLGDGNFASGATGGGPGRYAVYATWPVTSNVGGGLTNYQIDTTTITSNFSVDQNGGGSFGNVWVKVGEIDYTSGPITVTQTPTSNTAVSMRAAGVLFDLVSGGPPPGYTGPPGPVIFGEGASKSLGIAFLRNRTEAQSTHFAVVGGTDLVNWSTTDFKLFSITGFDADHDLVTFRSMAPMSAANRRFLTVRKTAKMPLGSPPRYVAVTYDDGPHPTRTPRLLDMLAARNIRATFYVTGVNAQAHPHLIRRMINEGHEVGNHSNNHERLTDLTDPEVIATVSACHDAVVAAATLPPATIRPPYGAVDNPLRDLFQNEFGYPTVLWDVDPRDWDMSIPDQEVINTILDQADHDEIILVHDIHERTINIMPTVLDGLLADGFSFLTISELLELQAP